MMATSAHGSLTRLVDFPVESNLQETFTSRSFMAKRSTTLRPGFAALARCTAHTPTCFPFVVLILSANDPGTKSSISDQGRVMMRIDCAQSRPKYPMKFVEEQNRGRTEQRVPKISVTVNIPPKTGSSVQSTTLPSGRTVKMAIDSVTAKRPTSMSRTNQEAYDPTVHCP